MDKKDCSRCVKNGCLDITCPFVLVCEYADGLDYKNGKKVNVTINKYNDCEEILYYKKLVLCPDYTCKDVDRSRKFENNAGQLVAKRSDVSFNDLQKTLFASGKRAKENFYGYALCNDWRYFLTLTFDPKKINRDNEDVLKYAWKLFRQKLQYIEKDVKILCVPERHPTSGKIHLHTLLGNIDLSDRLVNAISVKTGKQVYSRFGDTVYNITLWNYGFSTCIDLTEKGYDVKRVANYLIGYCTKENDIIGYNKKRYYHTKNLDYKEKKSTYLTKGELFDKVAQFGVEVVKDNEKFIVYRIDNELKKSLLGSVKEEVKESNIKIHNVSINGKNYMS